jgi:hypothetical protein
MCAETVWWREATAVNEVAQLQGAVPAEPASQRDLFGQ